MRTVNAVRRTSAILGWEMWLTGGVVVNRELWERYRHGERGSTRL